VPAGWRDRLDALTDSASSTLPDRLDQAVAATDLGVAKQPRWWAGVGALQGLLLLTAVVGGVWLLGLAVMAYFQLPEPSLPRWRGVPLPTLMLLGGALLGVVVGIVSRIFVRAGARRRGRRAGARLRAALTPLADRGVIGPVEAELQTLAACRAAAARALKGQMGT
jgi:hypothetical protein